MWPRVVRLSLYVRHGGRPRLTALRPLLLARRPAVGRVRCRPLVQAALHPYITLRTQPRACGSKASATVRTGRRRGVVDVYVRPAQRADGRD